MMNYHDVRIANEGVDSQNTGMKIASPPSRGSVNGHAIWSEMKNRSCREQRRPKEGVKPYQYILIPRNPREHSGDHYK
jgi:hypothetical protein